MSAPPPTSPPPPPAPAATPRGAQIALGAFLAVLVGLLAFRGYGSPLTAQPTEPVAAADLTDLNTADQKELAQVPGVGPKMAEAIVDHRRAHGPFKSVDELRSVRGVGPITFEKVRNQFRIGALPQAPPAETPPSPQPQAQPVPALVPVSAPAPAPRQASAGSKKLQAGEPPINVNTATADELQRLPGVGPVMASAIIAARAAAPFASVDDLRKVKGIGPKTLEKLRPFVVVK
jgi:competence protein ComEA